MRITNSEKHGVLEFSALALVNTQGTGPGGVIGEVVEVKSIAELQKLGAKAQGKDIFLNGPMDPSKIDAFEAYSGAVGQRGAGASEASKLGAIGVIIRSMTNRIDDIPHTGNQRYNPDYPKIPAIAISTQAATLFGKKEVFKSIHFENRYSADSYFYEQASKKYWIKRSQKRTYIYYRNLASSITALHKQSRSVHS
ncbi:hypothetical protein SAMN03080617_01440 [Algoriphagus alkaliphilus]|uniref:Uncharacterized protein n=1 Tax=Algoriphagus alkaliphilus TaxID=279824 RepID=A0A1G5WZC6_9BACT|nr:hypothetical protein SAMN03080617_01440 [Algoriphagus alkaliphilus]